MKVIFSVTTTIPTKSAFVWWPAEFDVPDDLTGEEALDYVIDVLIEDRLIRCSKIELEPGEGRERVIRNRVPLILGANVVGTITELHLPLVEPGRAPGYTVERVGAGR